MTTTSSLRILLMLCVAAFVMNITNYIFYSAYSERIRPPYYKKNQIDVCGRQSRPTEVTLGPGLLSKLLGAVRTKPDTGATCITDPTAPSEYDTTTDRLATSSTPSSPILLQ